MAPTPPQNTPEERANALQEALVAREGRAKVKDEIAHGRVQFADVIEEGAYGRTDEVGEHARVVGRIEVGDLVLAVDGVGPKHAAEALAAAGVEPDERVDTLNAGQRGAIVQSLIDQGLL